MQTTRKMSSAVNNTSRRDDALQSRYDDVNPSSCRRILFGPSDPKLTHSIAQQSMRLHAAEMKTKYNFDFETETPVIIDAQTKYSWENVLGDSVPEFYRPRAMHRVSAKDVKPSRVQTVADCESRGPVSDSLRRADSDCTEEAISPLTESASTSPASAPTSSTSVSTTSASVSTSSASMSMSSASVSTSLTSTSLPSQSVSPSPHAVQGVDGTDEMPVSAFDRDAHVTSTLPRTRQQPSTSGERTPPSVSASIRKSQITDYFPAKKRRESLDKT